MTLLLQVARNKNNVTLRVKIVLLDSKIYLKIVHCEVSLLFFLFFCQRPDLHPDSLRCTGSSISAYHISRDIPVETLLSLQCQF